MTHTPDKKTLYEQLRQKAEDFLKNKVPSPTIGLSEADVLRMGQELEVQKVELDIQSEELRIAQISAEVANDLYDYAPTGYYTLSRDGKIKGLNLSAANFFHQYRSALKGKLFSSFVAIESRPVFANFIHNVFQNHTKECCEICLAIPDQDTICVYLTGTLDKHKEFCLVTAVNTTERRKNEEIVEHERELYQDLVNNQPAGIYRIRVYHPDKWWKNAWHNSTNPPYKMEKASDRFCEILGITREEFETNPAIISDLIHLEDLPGFVRKNEEANSRMIPFKWEGRLVVHQKVCWVHLESYPRPQENGEIVWTGILYDITEQKQLHEELAESEKKYRELVDNSPNAICIYSHGKIVFVNKACLKLMAARDETELLGKKAIEMVHPDSRTLATERMLKIASEQNVQPLTEEKFIRLDRTTVEVEVTAMPIVYQQKQAVQLIVRDNSERKKTEHELHSSREEFRDLFEHAPVGYHEIDAQGRIVKMNHTEAEMLGYRKEELIGKSIWDICEDKAYSLHITQEKLKGRQISKTPYERNFLKKDGTKITVLIQDRILRSADGTRITGNRSSVQDITERKVSEENLRLSEAKFRSIFENSVMGKSMTTLDGILNVNKAFCQITGYSKEELSQVHWSKFSHKEDVEFNEIQLEKILKGEKTFAHWEKRYIHKKGHIVWVDICTFLIRDREGKPIHFITEFYDITERKKSEEALRESEERYKSISDNSRNAIMVMDIHGKIEWSNQATQVLLRHSEKQLLEAAAFTTFVAKESLGFVDTNYQAMLDKKTYQHQFQLTMVRSDGEKRICEKFMTNFTDRYGVLKIITVITDVTERIIAEDKLKSSEQKHRQILETAMDGFWIVSTKGEILEVNEAYVNMSGYSKDELLKMHIADVEFIELNKHVNDHIQTIIQNGQDRFETRHRRKDGTIIDVEICVQFQSATTQLLIAFIRDITERKFVEKALMESEVKFRKLFDHTPIPILYVNNYGVITHRNKKFIELLGYDENEVPTLAEWWHKAYPAEEYRKLVKGNWNRAVRKSGNVHGDIQKEIYHVTCKDGIEREIIITGSRFADNYLTTFVDVTDQKKAEKTLQESKEMLQKLLVTTSGLIDSEEKKFDYQRMTDIMIEISGARYAAFNLMEENTHEITTVAFSGLSDIQSKAKSIMGFNLVNRKWKEDPERAAKISEHIITRFETLHELTGGEVISNKVIGFIENTFHLGEINVVKITKNNKLIGDFTLLFTNDTSLQNAEIVELYVKSLGLFFERNIAIQSLRSSEEKYRYLFANNPQPMWIYDLKTLEFLEINQAAIDLYGYTREEFLSMSLKDIRPAEEVPKMIKDVQHTKGDVSSVGEWIHTKKNGENIIVDITIVSVVSNGRKARHAMMEDITERRKAEQALKESEDKYRTMIENSNDMIWTLDKDAKFTFLNEKALSTTGLVLEEWIGKSFLPLALEGELAMLMNVFVRTMDGESCTYELLYKVAEDTILTIETNTSPIMIAGIVVGVVSFGRDITEQKLAEKALQKSEDLYRNLVQKIPDGVYKSTSKGRFIDVNPAMVHLLGYESKEELMDIDIKSQLYFEATERESMVLKETYDGNAVFQLKKKDGSAIWVEDHGWFRTDDLGNIIYHEGVIRDITESKKALSQLQESEEKFRSIAEQTDDLISITDDNGILEYASPASLSIFQYTPEEMRGHYFTDFLDDKSIEVARAAFAKSLETGISVTGLELEMKRKDGSLFFGELNGSGFKYNNKNGTLVVVRDISERKKAQEELKERMVDLERFNKLTIDREINMIQLKKEVNELLQQAGNEGKYKIVI